MTQMLGKGVAKGIGVVAGWFGLPFSTGNWRGWKETEDLLGQYEKQVTDECCLANLQDEIAATLTSGKKEVNGRVPLTISTDTGWQGKGSTKSYNSLSGYNVAIGCLTTKVLDYMVKAKICRICEVSRRINSPTREHNCVANFVGCSKAMEPISTCQLAVKLWNKIPQGTKKVWVTALVTDDDSSTRSYMNTVGPTSNGKEKLPPEVTPPSTFYTDHTHRNRVWGGDVWKIVRKIYKFKSGHAERLKKITDMP